MLGFSKRKNSECRTLLEAGVHVASLIKRYRTDIPTFDYLATSTTQGNLAECVLQFAQESSARLDSSTIGVRVVFIDVDEKNTAKLLMRLRILKADMREKAPRYNLKLVMKTSCVYTLSKTLP